MCVVCVWGERQQAPFEHHKLTFLCVRLCMCVPEGARTSVSSYLQITDKDTPLIKISIKACIIQTTQVAYKILLQSAKGGGSLGSWGFASAGPEDLGWIMNQNILAKSWQCPDLKQGGSAPFHKIMIPSMYIPMKNSVSRPKKTMVWTERGSLQAQTEGQSFFIKNFRRWLSRYVLVKGRHAKYWNQCTRVFGKQNYFMLDTLFFQ